MPEITEKKEILLKAFEEKLNRIVSEIDDRNSSQVINVLTVVLLSLATIGSAWCAFQSTLWGGVQTFELAAYIQSGRLSSENFVKANQKRTVDAIMVMKYIDANEEGNIKLRDFYFSRFDPVLQKATLEWLKSDPFNNQNALNSPMKMPSYELKEETEAINQLNISVEKLASANRANKTSDRYVLLTVLFAGVLFFGGIASTLQSRLVRNVCLILSAIILCGTFVILMSMPVTTI